MATKKHFCRLHNVVPSIDNSNGGSSRLMCYQRPSILQGGGGVCKSPKIFGHANFPHDDCGLHAISSAN